LFIYRLDWCLSLKPGLSLYNYGFYWALQYAFIDCASRSERKRNTLLNEYLILHQCLKNTNIVCEKLIFNAWQTSQLVFVTYVLSDNHRCTDKTICKNNSIGKFWLTLIFLSPVSSVFTLIASVYVWKY